MSNRGREIPIVVLAGSDRRPGPVPSGGEELHFVTGYKGAELRLGERCLAQLLVERLRASEAFAEIYLAGPARVYGDLVDCRVIDTDGHVGRNIQAAIEAVQRRHGKDTLVAFAACDILPEPGEIRELAAELTAASSVSKSGLEERPAFAMAIIVAKGALGASGWKPRYRLRPSRGSEPVSFLPGHLVVAWPARLRTGLVFRLLQLAYRERNREYGHRRREILLRMLGTLLRRDLLNLVRLKPPTLTYRVLRHGLGAFNRWRRGELDIEGLARCLGGILVRWKHFRSHGASCVRLVTSTLISFAKDIDTREELEELGRQIQDKNGREETT